MKYSLLNNGVKVPSIGFGTHKMSDAEAEIAVYNAICAGYRHIDTAQIYQNEAGVGRAIKRSIDEKIVTRDDLFITTKTPWARPGFSETLEGFDESLRKLGLKYIDLYLIHHPFGNFFNQPYFIAQTARAVETLYKSGKIRAWGVSNFSIDDLVWVMKETETVPMVNQIEVHPLFHHESVVRYCLEQNIAVESWGALGQGRIFNILILKKLAEKYGKSVAQITVKWHLLKGYIPLVCSSNEEHTKQNLDVDEFEISDEDLKLIDSIKEYKDSWYRDGRYKLIGTMEQETFFRRISENVNYKKIYKLFNIFPILKEKRDNEKINFYLFGVIPILEVKVKKKSR